MTFFSRATQASKKAKALNPVIQSIYHMEPDVLAGINVDAVPY